MIIFIDEDEAYGEWLEANPGGFVLNMERNPKPSYLVLHRVECGQLHRNDSRQIAKTHEYIKGCSTDQQQLVGWIERRFGGQARMTLCQQCRP